MKLPVLAPGYSLDDFNALIRRPYFMFCELFTFTLLGGAVDHFTSLDMPVVFDSVLYKSTSLRIQGLKFKLAVGVEVDEQDVKITALPGETLCGSDFLSAASDGLLDGAYLTRYRAFFEPTTGIVPVDFAAGPVAIMQLFYGRIGEITRAGRTSFECKVKSPLVLLGVDIPRNYYYPMCSHILFDSGCTLSKAAFAASGTVGAGPGNMVIPWSGGVPSPTGGDGRPTYQFGRLLWLTGANAGGQASISSNDSSNLGLTFPTPIHPTAGDTFTAYAGCFKDETACDAKFSNKPHFRAFTHIPPAVAAV